jgi:cytochrome c-type biogenesis protein CcmH
MTRQMRQILVIIGFVIGFAISFVIGAGLLTPATIGTAHALTAEEMLADPALESRARNLSKQLRCLVCQNQSIDDSDAELAKDLRREVRTQLVAGQTDAAILSDLRAKYGDYVLLAPPLARDTMALWLAPVGFILLGIAITLGMRRRAAQIDSADNNISADNSISSADRARIDALKRQHENLNKRDTR